MFLHPATQQHLNTLRARGASVVGPTEGRLASGQKGEGRMSEPVDIWQTLRAVLGASRALVGRRVLVTAGPTYEPIDRVRFIGNRSSGKMGYAVAAEAQRRGADVTLVSGPVALAHPDGMRVVHVERAQEMRGVVLELASQQDVVVMAAAVADFEPATVVDGKARRVGPWELNLVPTPDIAADAVAAAPDAFHVGFALEPSDLVQRAREKLERKGQQLVVANAIDDEHNPFGSDHNRVVFVTAQGEHEQPIGTKAEVARRLWDEIESAMGARDSQAP